MRTIDARTLSNLMQGSDRIVVVDVLPEESYDEHHVPGAHNVPANDPDFEDRVDELVDSRGDTVVVYCANPACDLSPKAARRLEDKGFTDVLDFEGGIEAWEETGYQVAGTAAAGRE